MMTERALLPEFKAIRYNAEAGPVWRSWNFPNVESKRRRCDFLLQFKTIFHAAGLTRGPRSYLAEPRASGKICIRLCIRNCDNGTFNPYLAFEAGPVDAECGARIHLEIMRFRTFQIGVENQSGRIR